MHYRWLLMFLLTAFVSAEESNVVNISINDKRLERAQFLGRWTMNDGTELNFTEKYVFTRDKKLRGWVPEFSNIVNLYADNLDYYQAKFSEDGKKLTLVPVAFEGQKAIAIARNGELKFILDKTRKTLELTKASDKVSAEFNALIDKFEKLMEKQHKAETSH